MKPLSIAALFAVLLASLVGCASADEPHADTSEGELRPAPSALSMCPRTFADANGATCEAGLSCLYSLECGATNQQTRCECENGKLACADRVGPIPVGEKQLCAPGSTTDKTECPVSQAAALGTSCTTAGRVCAYRGKACHTVPGQVLLDWCRCSPDGEGGFKYNCGQALCPPPP